MGPWGVLKLKYDSEGSVPMLSLAVSLNHLESRPCRWRCARCSNPQHGVELSLLLHWHNPATNAAFKLFATIEESCLGEHSGPLVDISRANTLLGIFQNRRRLEFSWTLRS